MVTKMDRFMALDLPQLEEAITKVESDLSAIEAEIKPLERERDRQDALIKHLHELRDEKIIARMGDTPDWEWLLSYSTYPSDSMAKFRKRDQALSVYGLMTVGSSGETNQSLIEIVLNEGDDAGRQACLTGLQQILPVLKPGVNGCKEIEVVTQDLGETGHYILSVAPDDSRYELVLQRYRHPHPETLHVEQSLAPMLKCIQQHYHAF